VVAGPAAAAGLDSATLLSQQFAELRAGVLGEVEVLRGQVASLTDQNQAFVFRIKQLEDYAQRQEQAVARLNQQLAELQQQLQQQHQQQQGLHVNRSNGLGDAADSASGAGGVVRRGSDGSGAGAAGQAAAVPGGSFWSTQSAVL
jgi:TolA-binding protein